MRFCLGSGSAAKNSIKETGIDAYIDLISQFIEQNSAWAGPILGLIALGESLIVVGLFIPATALLLLAGGLVGSGELQAGPILAWGIAGAVAGDAISYFLGRWIGPGIQRRWPLNKQRTGVARARLFFSRYGFLAILLGRFLGPIRSTIPLVAGVMGMRHLPFQLANVLSAIAWVPLMLLPGWLAARGVAAAGGSQNVLMIAGTVMSILFGLWLFRAMIRPRQSVSVPGKK